MKRPPSPRGICCACIKRKWVGEFGPGEAPWINFRKYGLHHCSQPACHVTIPPPPIWGKFLFCWGYPGWGAGRLRDGEEPVVVGHVALPRQRCVCDAPTQVRISPFIQCLYTPCLSGSTKQTRHFGVQRHALLLYPRCARKAARVSHKVT